VFRSEIIPSESACDACPKQNKMSRLTRCLDRIPSTKRMSVTNMATRLRIASFDHGELGFEAGSTCVP
jgi:hypothetical protein